MASFRHKATSRTTDMFKSLTSMERHVLFLESLMNEKLSQAKYQELLRAHYPDKSNQVNKQNLC